MRTVDVGVRLLIAAAGAPAWGCGGLLRQPDPNEGPRLVVVADANVREDFGAGPGASADAAGVTVSALAGAWSGQPADLAGTVVPILVTITNNNPHPLRVRLDQFALISAREETFVAVPPYPVSDTTRIVVAGRPYRPAAGFAVAPHLARTYIDRPVYSGPFDVNEVHHNTYRSILDGNGLPTADVVGRALPEGVLAPRGTVGGFLYFQDVGPLTTRFRLRADLVDADSGIEFARISIPFVVRD